MSSTSENIAVVGGGLLGLTLALRLSQRGHQVTVFEAADHVGGLADAWQLGDVVWDRHYHVTLLSDSCLRRVLAELGLDDQLQWRTTRTGFYVNSRLYSLSNSWEFLRFPPLGLWSKLRLGWTIHHASRLRDWKKLESIPVADWLIKHSGRRTFERIWLPLLKSKLGQAYKRTSAAFIWATIARMYAARRTGLKREMFGYLPGGYARMLATYRTHLEKQGITIRTSSRIERIEDSGSGLVIRLPGEQLAFDRVIVTCPAPVAAKICDELTPEEKRRLESIEYLGIVCASVLLKKPLSDYYVTNITDEVPFTGVIEMTALIDPAEVGGHALAYLPKYVTADDDAISRSDDEIRESYLSALERMYPEFQRGDVLAFRVSRVRHVFALSTLNYSSRVPPVETSLPGLYIVNSSQIVNGTLNVNETVRLAEESLDTICQPLPVREIKSESPYEASDRELVARLG